MDPARPPLLPLFLTLLAAILLAGCTGDGDDGKRTADAPDPGPDPTNNTTAPQETVDVRLTGAYPATIAYDPATITVPVGANVTIRFTNSDQAPIFNHDWVLEGYEDTASTEVIGNGETSEVTFAAPPAGTYAFYCSVPGHRGNGMEGSFVVE